MTLTSQELSEELSEALGPVVVQGTGSSFIINVPTGRYAHDRTTLALERSGDDWVISDGGQLSALLLSDFGAIIDVLECAGAPFVAERGQVVARTSSQHVTELVLSYVNHILAAPIVWQARQCMLEPADPARHKSVARRMARNTFDLVANELTVAERHFIWLQGRVAGKGETTTAPFCVLRDRRDMRPQLVSSFIDLRTGGPGAASAKRNVTYLHKLLEDLRIPKYVVVRGEPHQLNHLRSLFDEDNVQVVAEEGQELLVHDAVERVHELLHR